MASPVSNSNLPVLDVKGFGPVEPEVTFTSPVVADPEESCDRMITAPVVVLEV